jgi:hypothetical protein
MDVLDGGTWDKQSKDTTLDVVLVRTCATIPATCKVTATCKTLMIRLIGDSIGEPAETQLYYRVLLRPLKQDRTFGSFLQCE